MFILINFQIFSSYGKAFDLIFVQIFCVSAQEQAIWRPFLTDQSRIFHWKTEKYAACEGKKDEKVLVSRQSRHSAFLVNMGRERSLICTLTWRVYIFVSRQGKGTNRRNKKTIIIDKICIVVSSISTLSINLTVVVKVFSSSFQSEE